ncbi:MAG: hypothetical protein H7Z43_16125 [Clostridia bacterium]|nr:hypothetical protein [Deltaproteobacteria bacterium]
MANRLSDNDAVAFEEHLRLCETCRLLVTRHKAVERAAVVLNHNKSARDSNGLLRPDSAPTPIAPPHKTVTVETATAPRSTVFDSPTQTRPLWSRSMPAKRFVLTVAAIMFAGGLFWVLTHHRAGKTAGGDETTVAVPSEPTLPVELSPKEAPAPAVPALEPVVPAATVLAAPVEAAPIQAAPGIPEPGPAGFFAVGTDIETLAQVVGSKRCGQAVSALKARVVSNPNEVRSWVLLTQCYAKRRRWRETVEAYDNITRYGDKAAVASVQSEIARARSAIEAETNAPAVSPVPKLTE